MRLGSWQTNGVVFALEAIYLKLLPFACCPLPQIWPPRVEVPRPILTARMTGASLGGID